MGYSSMNFLENIGLIAFLFVFVLARQLVGLVVLMMARALKMTQSGEINNRFLTISGSVYSNMWLRFLLMTYFEVVIACLLGTNI